MARMRRKGDLPTKVCATCARPFAWRKRWARVWDEVRYCSDACRSRRPSTDHPGAVSGRTASSMKVQPD